MVADAAASSSSTNNGPSPGRIHSLEMNNFKSYGGKRTIGPFGSFTAVIGPNGAGKSNLMDAVSFVVGLASRELRGKQLKDLIYRNTTDTGDEERSASVSLVYERDGKKTVFKRSISTLGVGEYRVDGRAFKADAYFTRLKALGIHTKAHLGFLVFQVEFCRGRSLPSLDPHTLAVRTSFTSHDKPRYSLLAARVPFLSLSLSQPLACRLRSPSCVRRTRARVVSPSPSPLRATSLSWRPSRQWS